VTQIEFRSREKVLIQTHSKLEVNHTNSFRVITTRNSSFESNEGSRTYYKSLELNRVGKIQLR